MRKFILLFITLQIYSNSIHAQWSNDPQVADTKVSTTNVEKGNSRIISDGSGGAIIFWISERNDTGYDIYYNRLNSDGFIVWAPVTLGISLTNTPGYNVIEQVISDGNGGAFISWRSVNRHKSVTSQFLQHINSSGAKTWGNAGLLLTEKGGWGSYICRDGNGGLIVTWGDDRNDLVNELARTYAQRISSSGNQLWGTGVQVLTSPGYNFPFAILSDGNGGAFISIIDTRNDPNFDPTDFTTSNLDIYAQRINSSGKPVWIAEGVPVCTQTKNQSANDYLDQNSYMASDGAGGVFIAWEDYRNDPDNYDGSSYKGVVFCQRINANGAAQWTTNGVAFSNAETGQIIVNLMSDGAGGVMAVWNETIGDNDRLVMQIINANGSLKLAATGKLIISGNDVLTFAISPDATNSAMLLTWIDDRDVIAQRVNASDASFMWGNKGTLVCHSADYLREPSITNNGGAGAIISWTDPRNYPVSASDIYANRVLANGTLPVILVSFDAQLFNANVLLQWNTSSEQNTSYFEIERSADGTYFSAIGNLTAAGNSFTAINYSFTDKSPVSGTNFYRLKMVDINGKFSYSKTIPVKIENVTSFKIYPNPAKNTLYIQTGETNEKAIIQITDLAGKKVKEQMVSLNKNTPIDISNLATGIYKIIIKTATNTLEQKFVKE